MKNGATCIEINYIISVVRIFRVFDMLQTRISWLNKRCLLVSWEVKACQFGILSVF